MMTKKSHHEEILKQTILIIDDNPGNLSVITDYLGVHGFQIMVAREGETGLKLASRYSPDLILLDVRMPGIDGFEVCRQLKLSEHTREIPVIFMTVAISVEDKVRGFELGGVDYITKPFQQEEVLARVSVHMKIRVLTQQLEETNNSLEKRVIKRTEELTRANKALQESKERYRIVFENSPVSIWEEDFSQVKIYLDNLKERGITDIDSYFNQHPESLRECTELIRINDVNQAALDLHGATTKEELLEGLIKTFSPESFNTLREELLCIWNGESEKISDAVIKSLTGDSKDVTVYFSVCPGYETSYSKTLVSLIDITDRKIAEKALIQLNKELELRISNRTTQLEASNKELESFAYSVSHDLRAPLRHVKGFISLLENEAGKDLNEKSQGYMSHIINSANKMDQLIGDLLSFSRIRLKEMKVKEVNLGEIVSDVIHELESDNAERNIKWQIENLSVVNGDPSMMRIVIMNLMANAVKFTRSREEAVIEAGCESRTGEIVIFVRDNGVGYNPQYADKLFGVFQRLHRADEFEGTGVGLAMVQRIIHRHGGRVWARGEVDRGATFYFSLPKMGKKEHGKI